MHIEFETIPGEMPLMEERDLIADALRAAPGRIHRLCAGKNAGLMRQYAYTIRRAKDNMRMFTPAGSFEAEVKTMFGLTYVFVRYVGEREDSDGQ